MEISIGIRNVQRELSLDVDLTAEDITAKVTEALSSGTPLSITDTDGKVVIVPSAAIGYVQLDEAKTRRVGFGF